MQKRDSTDRIECRSAIRGEEKNTICNRKMRRRGDMRNEAYKTRLSYTAQSAAKLEASKETRFARKEESAIRDEEITALEPSQRPQSTTERVPRCEKNRKAQCA